MQRWQIFCTDMLPDLSNYELDLSDLQKAGLPYPLPVYTSHQDAWHACNEFSADTDFEWGVREIYPSLTLFGLHFYTPTEEEVKHLPLNLQFLWHANVDYRLQLKFAANGHILYTVYQDEITQYELIQQSGFWRVTHYTVSKIEELDLDGVNRIVSTQVNSKK